MLVDFLVKEEETFVMRESIIRDFGQKQQFNALMMNVFLTTHGFLLNKTWWTEVLWIPFVIIVMLLSFLYI